MYTPSQPEIPVIDQCIYVEAPSIPSFDAIFRKFVFDYVEVVNTFWEIVAPLFTICSIISDIFEPPHEKTNNLHMRKQRRRSASR